MKKQDFELIAGTIQQMPDSVRTYVALKFSERLKHSNPAFKEQLFLKACGLDLHERVFLPGVNPPAPAFVVPKQQNGSCSICASYTCDGECNAGG